MLVLGRHGMQIGVNDIIVTVKASCSGDFLSRCEVDSGPFAKI